MKVIGVIPARYGSTRLEGKPLKDICGKPMIQYVYAAAQKARLLDQVYVATDDPRIVAAVERTSGAGSGGAWSRLAVAQALAALGRAAEASRAATAATAAGCSIASAAYDGATCALVQAQVLARAGEARQATALLERVLAVPSPASVAWLRTDPAWDALRADPAFAHIVR